MLTAGLPGSKARAGKPKPGRPYWSEQTLIRTPLDDPAAKAVLAKHPPRVVEGGQPEMARQMILKKIQARRRREKRAQIDANLARLPAK